MALLTIGAFAKASRLSQKALRLYDELGLLTPADVDPVTGYRRYDPGQLERARLVAWLRRLGMPLARIRSVCALDADAAAGEVRAWWARVEAETAARAELAAFLVDHLAGGSGPPGAHRREPAMTPGLRYAALSDVGLVRDTNQDAVHAGPRLLAVADGFGDAGGAASAAAVDALRPLASEGAPAGGLLNVLEDAVERAGAAVRAVDASGASGTTLSALLWTGSRLALVHIGDSRVHLLRDGAFFQVTHDHTLVSSLVEEGRLAPEEAASHPERALLLRALAGGAPGGAHGTADLRLRDALPGDRYLLCSDGLWAVVPEEAVRAVLTGVDDPADAVRDLVALAHRHGGPDNVSCVVADVLEGPGDEAAEPGAARG